MSRDTFGQPARHDAARRYGTALASGLYWGAAAMFAAGIGFDAPVGVALGTLFVAAGFIVSDVRRIRVGGVTSMTLSNVTALASAYGTVLAFLAADTPRRGRYFLFTSEEHLMFALLLGAAGVVLPVWGFWAVARRAQSTSRWLLLPPIVSHLPDRDLVRFCAVASSCAIAWMIFRPAVDFKGVSNGSMFSTLIAYTPAFCAFLLGRAAAEQRARGAAVAGATIALADAARAFLTEWARGNVITAPFAFGCGVLFGTRSLRTLLRPSTIVVGFVSLLWISNYGLIGEIRGLERGWDKVAKLWDHHVRTRDSDLSTRQTVLARLTSFNQLSQIGRIVDEDGFYDGRTFDYLAIVFVPRVLWPEKPPIQKGAWFAMRIGQATRTEAGWYSNSVNMTNAGELYLNFGWLGVLIGLPLLGAFLAVLWRKAAFWDSPQNVLGGAFALYLLWVGLGGLGDFLMLVALIITYVIFLALSFLAQVAQLTAQRARHRRRSLPAPIADPLTLSTARGDSLVRRVTGAAALTSAAPVRDGSAMTPA